MIKYITKMTLILGVLALTIILSLGYLSSYFGWYVYDKDLGRKATKDSVESKNRNVFVKSLNFRIDSFPEVKNFQVYIEKGFRYGRHFSEVTDDLVNSQFPYQISFRNEAKSDMLIRIDENDLMKFDSTNNYWGYLKIPHIKDTITLTITANNRRTGKIKVWE